MKVLAGFMCFRAAQIFSSTSGKDITLKLLTAVAKWAAMQARQLIGTKTHKT
jgi:hypothetical protein